MARPTQMTRNNAKRKTKNPQRRNMWLLIVTTLLLIGSIILFMPPQEKINQGLDIQGGLSVVLTATSADDSSITDEDMEKSRAIIESRVNALGASEAVVQVQGNNQILVQIPGLSDTQTALDTIGRTGKLEFARLDSFTDQDTINSIRSGSYAQEGYIMDEFNNIFTITNTEGLKVEEGTYTPIVTGENIRNVTVSRASETSAYYAVNIELDSEGTDAFAQASSDLARSHGLIVIILDNKVQSAPAVQSEIPNGRVQITGNYTLEEAQALQTILESGSLPVNFQYSQSQVVGPTLGQDALFMGVIVALIGILLVMLYLLFFYKGLGIITAAAVVVFAIFYLGILAALSAFHMFSLTLAGIAGIVLTIGMAADSSVLTVERFREEVRMGKSIKSASVSGVKHAILTSIDADLVSLVSALSLFFLASASVKGFGLTLALGIFCDIIMMVLFKAPLIRLLAPRTMTEHPGFWNLKDSQIAAVEYDKLAETLGVTEADAEVGEALDPEKVDQAVEKRAGTEGVKLVQAVHSLKGRFIKHDIDFMGKRKIFLTASAVVVVLALAIIGLKGLSFGIEFVGGTSITFHDTGDVSLAELRTAFDEEGQENAVIQTTTTDGQEGFLVRLTVMDAQEATAIANAIADDFDLTTENFEVTTIGPDWGTTVITQSLIAFAVSLVLIIAYVAIRFRELKMGITAVIVLLHDLIIVIGVYALVGREFTPNAVAALLTIIGYSLYDTVVVFHRINDNAKSFNVRCTFMTMANHSLNQVFIRSINTTMTSLIPVLAMLFFGGSTLQDFAFAMSIGLIIGCYSSIAIGTPLYAMWKTREPKYAKLQAKMGPVIGNFEFIRTKKTLIETIGRSTAARLTKAQAQAAARAGAQTKQVAVIDTVAVEEDVPTQSVDVEETPTQGVDVEDIDVEAIEAEEAPEQEESFPDEDISITLTFDDDLEAEDLFIDPDDDYAPRGSNVLGDDGRPLYQQVVRNPGKKKGKRKKK